MINWLRTWHSAVLIKSPGNFPVVDGVGEPVARAAFEQPVVWHEDVSGDKDDNNGGGDRYITL